MDRTEGFGVHIDRTLKKIQGVFLKVFAENHIDLTIEQWVILQRVYLEGGTTSQAQISHSNFRNRATTSRVIHRLCQKGFLQKSRFTDDQKRYKLSLTDTGSQLIQQVLPIIQKIRKMSVQHIPPQEFDVFLKVLEQLWTNFDSYEKGEEI